MKSFFHNIKDALVPAALALSLYSIVSILFFANSLYYESSMRALQNTAQALIAALPEGFLEECFEDGGAASLLLEQLERQSHYRVTLIRPNGELAADSRLDHRNAENHSDRPEFTAAISGEVGSARRRSASLGTEYLYAALPVYRGGTENAAGLIGVFRISLMVESFQRRIFPAVLPFLGCGLLVILAVFTVLYRFSRSLTRRLEAILNGMDEAVLALDGDLIVQLINPRARSLLNISRPAPFTFGEAGCLFELEEAARTALVEKKALEREVKIEIRGAVRHFRLFAAPLAGSGERVVMVLGDLTRLHRLERVRQDFAANVSHELRTPIQLIKGFAETLEETGAGGEQLRRGLEIIRKNALTMENLTGDLLSLVSLEDETQGRPEMRLTGVKSLIEEAAASVENAAVKKNISIRRDCAEDLAAPLHEGFMVQALVNLLDNAVKYSPAGSEVRLEASIYDCEKCGDEKRGGEKPELVIKVRDRGIGIPLEHQSRIFERFYRVDKSRSREQGGTGLGLSIVRHIALIHKGAVEVESRAGEGSLFTLRIPIPAAPSETGILG